MKNLSIFMTLRISAILIGIYFLSSCYRDDLSAHDSLPPSISLLDPAVQVNSIILTCSLDMKNLVEVMGEGYHPGYFSPGYYIASSANGDTPVGFHHDFIFEYGTDRALTSPLKVVAEVGQDCFYAELIDYIPGEVYYYRANIQKRAFGQTSITSEIRSFTAPEMLPSVEIGGLIWATANVSGGDGYNDNSDDWYYTWDQAMSLCPDGWSLPTENELDDLINNGSSWRSSLSNSTPNDRAGLWLGLNHKKAVAGNPGVAIFLPACGYRDINTGFLNHFESYGSYWSSSFSGDNACYLSFGEEVSMEYNRKDLGRSVRCVKGLSNIPRLALDIVNIKATSANFSGNITFDGGAAITERGFMYSEVNINPALNNPSFIKVISTLGVGEGRFKNEIIDLKVATTYYVWAYAVNANLTSYSDVVEFTTTSALGAPVYKDANYSDFGVQVANLWWAPVNLGATLAGHYGGYYQFGSSSEGLASGWTAPNNAWNGGTKDAPVKTSNDPCPSGWRIPTSSEFYTLYKADNTTFSRSSSWDTFPGILRITCNTTGSYIELPAAGYRGYSDGQMVGLGTSGCYWSSSSTTTTTNNNNISNFPAASHIHYMHFNQYESDYFLNLASYYKTNGLSIRCIQDLSVSRSPSVITGEVTNIQATAATYNANLIDDGEALGVERGFVYSKTNNLPSLEDDDNTIKISSISTGTGKYSSNVTGLSLSTKYYVRAYALSPMGTSYGVVKTFTTVILSAPAYVDGSYEGVGVKIGNLWWAPVNVSYTSAPPYGLLFNWGVNVGFKYGTTGQSSAGGSWAEKDQGPCPNDWYIPSARAYENLLLAANSPLGSDNYPGQWRSSRDDTPNDVAGRWFGADSESATASSPGQAIFFPAVGYWYPSFSGKDNMGLYWSGTYGKSLYFDSGNAKMDSNIIRYGLAIRCVRD